MYPLDISANNVLDLNYNFYFDFKFMALDNMLRNAKMLTKSIKNLNELVKILKNPNENVK